VEKPKGLQALQNLVKRYDYHETGGADLLGIDGICIICHGSSRERAIFNALAVAEKHAQARVNEATLLVLICLSGLNRCPV